MSVDVLIAGTPADPHCGAVAEHLRSRGASVLIASMDAVPAMSITWSPTGRIAVRDDEGEGRVVDAATTTWWRRPGYVWAAGLGELERQLVADELSVLWPGVLEAVGVRWVDAPWRLLRGRLKPVQLAVAASIGVAVPETIVSGEAAVAQDFSRGRDVVAKAVSSGEGLAPFVDIVPAQALGLLGSCPVLLQEFLNAEVDLRAVTVGAQTFCWRRPRAEAVVDWRAVDPAGVGFLRCKDLTGGKATLVAAALGLSFSVQDWLIVNDEAVFLEVNPQGQFLFLAEANSTVVPSLAQHLLGQ